MNTYKPLKYCFNLVLTLLLCTLAQAKELSTMEFTAIGWNAPLSNVKYITVEQAPTVASMDIPKDQRSEVQYYKGESNVFFFQEQKSADGSSKQVPLANFKVPETNSRVLLFFREDKTSENGYSVNWYPDDPVTFPNGSFHVINNSLKELKIQIGEIKSTLVPGQRKVYQPSTDAPHVQCLFESFRKDKWRPIFNSTIVMDKSVRTLLVIYPAANPERFDIKLFNDQVTSEY